MKSREEIRKALNKINVKIQLAPNELTGWDIIRLYTDYPYQDINEYARSLKSKLPRSHLISPALIREIADFLASPDVNLRAMAEHILNDIDNEESKKFLSPKALNLRWISSPDLDPYLLAEAARYLGDIGEPESIGPLIKTLAHPHRLVRGNAAQALGKIGDRRAKPHLIKLLEDKEVFVREKAVAALLSFPDQDVIMPLVRAYKENYMGREVVHKRIKKNCSRAILNIGLPAAVVLSDIVRGSEEPAFRIWALTMLLLMGVLPVTDFLQAARENAVDKRIELMHHTFRDLNIDITRYREYLMPLVAATQNLEFLKMIVYVRERELKRNALNRIHQLNRNVFNEVFGEVILCNWPYDKEICLEFEDSILPAVKLLLGRCGPQVRVNCLQLLGEMANRKGIKLVEEQLADADSQVRKEALTVILRAGGPMADIPVGCLNELLSLLNTDLDGKAMAAIRKMGDDVFDYLGQNLFNRSGENMAQVIRVLETLGGHKAVSLLLKVWRKNRRSESGILADEALKRLGKKTLLSRMFLR